MRPHVDIGDRVYYVEDGYVRGFCLVARVGHKGYGMRCETTGRAWAVGWYVFMDATTWRWIKPIPMRGFQGYRLVAHCMPYACIQEMGGWLDPKPPLPTFKFGF